MSGDEEIEEVFDKDSNRPNIIVPKGVYSEKVWKGMRQPNTSGTGLHKMKPLSNRRTRRQIERLEKKEMKKEEKEMKEKETQRVLEEKEKEKQRVLELEESIVENIKEMMDKKEIQKEKQKEKQRIYHLENRDEILEKRRLRRQRDKYNKRKREKYQEDKERKQREILDQKENTMDTKTIHFRLGDEGMGNLTLPIEVVNGIVNGNRQVRLSFTFHEEEIYSTNKFGQVNIGFTPRGTEVEKDYCIGQMLVEEKIEFLTPEKEKEIKND